MTTGAAVAAQAVDWSVPVPHLEALGLRAFTTTRAAGSYSTAGTAPVSEIMERWRRLQLELAPAARRLATSVQVHGNRVLVHEAGWEGWLRGPEADGHFAPAPGTALAVSIADCVPVFLAHPSGAVALLHSGWRGTAARIVERAIALFHERGLAPRDLHLATGPAICGRCYEVSPHVYEQLTGRATSRHRPVDLRALIVEHAASAGGHKSEVSALCTRCGNDRFYAHRAGDAGRQLAVIAAPS